MKSILLMIATAFRMVVIPAQFSDCEFSSSRSEIMLAVDAMQEYFNKQYGDKCTFTFEVAPNVTLSHPHSYYGNNYTDRKDALLHEAVREACNLSTSIDFNTCDNDGDGYVDNVMLFVSGKSETDGAGEDWIWPQRDFLRSNGGSLLIRGARIDGYTVVPEGKIGMACHEMGHVLGLCDLYDTDGEGSGGQSKALWGTGLMDLGCLNGDGNTPPNFSAIDLELLDIGQCTPLTVGSHTLFPIDKKKEYLRMDTDTDGEFFLFECRSASGNDKFIGGSGLIVYHIDMSNRPAGYSEYYKVELNAYERWMKSQVNCRPDRQCAMIVPAVEEAVSPAGIFFPQRGISSLSSSSNSAFRFWSGKQVPLALTGITLGTDGSLSFKVVEPMSISDIITWQDGATICWTIDENIHGISGFELECSDGEESKKISCGKEMHSFVVEGLKPRTRYSFTITALSSGGDTFSVAGEFTTKVMMDGTYPYIYLQTAARDDNGRFIKGAKIPLRVFNAAEAESVEWFMDDKRIQVDGSGYYTIEASGCLTARVHMKDGSTTVLMKEIITI